MLREPFNIAEASSLELRLRDLIHAIEREGASEENTRRVMLLDESMRELYRLRRALEADA